MDPKTMMAIASTAMKVVGQIQQGAMAQSMHEYNAQVQEIEAQNAQNASEYEERLHRERGKRLLSSQRTDIAASGLGLEGSSLLAIEESAVEIEKDALAIRYSGSVAAARARSQAAADRMQGRAAKTAGMWGAGKSLLTGASKISWSPSEGVED